MDSIENNREFVDVRPAWASITSFVCSIVGLFVLGVVLGIVAIVFGIIAVKKLQRFKGLAIAGIIIGVVDIIAFFVIASRFSGYYY